MNIVLAYLNKLHNDQQVTYIAGGKKPAVDTDFFICAQGLERISLVNLPFLVPVES
jgi:hypothetical protein